MSQRKGRKMKLKRIVIGAIILIGAFLFSSCSEKNRDVPESLMGKWTTSATGYQDYYFELAKKTITYGHNRGEQDVFPISSFEKKQEGKDVVYTIKYKNTDVKLARSFYYDPGNGGTIKFEHQEHIKWHKLKDDDLRENSETGQGKDAG
jgi:helix-turn-helix protein